MIKIFQNIKSCLFSLWTERLFNILIITVYILLTFNKMLTHEPSFDEAHAWLISYWADFKNLPVILNLEGHGVIWYLLLMPFAKYTDLYPYPMLIINYVASVFAISVFVIKSPFNKPAKILMTFSFMFVSYFSVIARCYSIGILGLFIIAYLYTKSYKNPILYSFLLGFTLNTSPMAAIGVSAFTLLFFYDLFKNNIYPFRKKLICFGIVIFAYLLLIYPILFCGNGMKDVLLVNGLNVFIEKNKFFFFPKNNYLFLPSFVFCLIYLFRVLKDFRVKFFLSFTCFSLFCLLTFIYRGEFYHRFFYVLFMIIALWISNCRIKLFSIDSALEFLKFLLVRNKITEKLFLVLFFIVLYSPQDIGQCLSSPGIREFADFFNNNSKEFQGSYFFIPNRVLSDQFLPYVIKKNKQIDFFIPFSTRLYENFYYNMTKFENLKDSDFQNFIYSYTDSIDRKFYILNYSWSEVPQWQDKIWWEFNDFIIYRLK